LTTHSGRLMMKDELLMLKRNHLVHFRFSVQRETQNSLILEQKQHKKKQTIQRSGLYKHILI